MATLPTPAPGDVIFTRDVTKAATLQSMMQPLIDKEARGSEYMFSHVALVFAPERAVEAVPHGPKFAEKLVFGELVDGQRVITVDVFEADGENIQLVKKTYPASNDHDFREYSKRTKVPLTRGIRSIPTADIILDAYEKGMDTVVLRKPVASDRSAKVTARVEAALLPILGSAYDLAGVADRLFGRNPSVVDFFLSRLKTKPNDAPTLLDLSPEQLEALAEHASGWLVTSGVASFYCSDLVAQLLVTADLATQDEVEAQFTPTGLYRTLLRHGWKEVTATDYSTDSVIKLRASSGELTSQAISFLNWYWIHKVNVQAAALDVTAQLIKSHNDKFTARLEALTRGLRPT